MAQFNKDGLTFEKYKTAGINLPIWPLKLSNQLGPDEDGGIVNAIDIDWNGVILDLPNFEDNTPIYTTGDLLNIFKMLAETLSIPVEDISINKDSLYIPINETATIIGTLLPNNASNNVINWTSSNTSVATITESTNSGEPAIINWKKGGETTITAKSNELDKTLSCRVICEYEKYLYIGTNKPINLFNASKVNSYEKEYITTNDTGEKSKIYVLTTSKVNVSFYEPVFGLEIDKVIDSTSIPGYYIYETANQISIDGTVKIKIKS